MSLAVVCDLDGPILDTARRHHECYSRILRKYGHEPLAPTEYWNLKRSGASVTTQLSRSSAEGILAVFRTEWLNTIETAELLAFDSVHDGVLDRLRSWKSRGTRLALATLRRNRAGLFDQMEQLELKALFDQILVVEHEHGGAGKTNGVRRWLAQAPAQKVLWIGDSEVDVDAARLLGSPIVLVLSGVRDSTLLSALRPDAIVETLSVIDPSTYARPLAPPQAI